MINEIINYKRLEIEDQIKKVPLDALKNKIKGISRGDLFKKVLAKKGELAIIAELKKASPSKGVLRQEFNIEAIAKVYAESRVDALSVLTEKKYFLGDKDYIPRLRKVVDIPLLQKDFFIDAYQIYEAAALGADCILLIASILKEEELLQFLKLAQDLNLSAVVEIHDKNDLEKALASKPQIIGINNRNLKTFEVNIKTTFELLALINNFDGLKVSESGISTPEDMQQLKRAGIDAVLVGETFMTSDDIKNKVSQLKGEI
jgi:indole-3-glycerol phosphate synthase